MNEIKQEVSSFRYELLEILRNNGMTIPDYEKKPNKTAQGSMKRRRNRTKTKRARM